jgi:hypothetical protein
MTTPAVRIEHGILKIWTVGTYLASVQLLSSPTTYIDNIPVSRNIASAEMVVGRRIAVAFFDPSNPADAVLFAVFT